MASVVADTHVLLWSLYEPTKLSGPAMSALQRAFASGDPVFVSTISLVEICYLCEKGKLVSTIFDSVVAALQTPSRGLRVANLDSGVAQALRSIPRGAVPEMPDRIIAATAAHLALPLVTRDQKIRASGIRTIW